MHTKLLIVVLLMQSLHLSTAAFGEPEIITGHVRDANTHIDISNVNIFVKGTQIGVTSDRSGEFALELAKTADTLVIVFAHIAFERREIQLSEVRKMAHVNLQPRVIPLQGVRIERDTYQMEIEKDLPLTVTTIQAKSFAVRGYTDAGDLLRIDQSVQMDENLSGRKTIGIRGGNSDDVVVLFNGVKLNNSYNNVFDLSSIDLGGVERFEIIKGSNTSLYGPEALAGVVNIVPITEQNYLLRFQQRFGTYRSGNWGVHLYKETKGLKLSTSYRKSGVRREFNRSNDALINGATYATGSLLYDFARDSLAESRKALSLMWNYTAQKYENQRDLDRLRSEDKLLSMRYSGEILKLRDVDVILSLHDFNERQFRDVDERSFHLDFQKAFKFRKIELLTAYQYQSARLNFMNQPITKLQQAGLQAATFRRQRHGVAAIAKYHGDAGSEFLKNVDVDVSIRYDRSRDKHQDPVFYQNAGSTIPENYQDSRHWEDVIVKAGVRLDASRRNLIFAGYANFGSNFKFPSLLQQVSTPSALAAQEDRPRLSPEKSHSVELGFDITRDASGENSIYGWQASGLFFQTFYENRFRQFTSALSPIVYYDNVLTAKIAGFESWAKLFLFRKKITLDLAFSRYFVTEKAVFPFKADVKRSVGLSVDHEGYSFKIFWFFEGDKIAWLRQPDNNFRQVPLPSYSNLDMHLGKSFRLSGLKLFANLSGRNLLNDDGEELEGLAFRDRRIYLTIGAEY